MFNQNLALLFANNSKEAKENYNFFAQKSNQTALEYLKKLSGVINIEESGITEKIKNKKIKFKK
jgi:hypothetical protein